MDWHWNDYDGLGINGIFIATFFGWKISCRKRWGECLFNGKCREYGKSVKVAISEHNKMNRSAQTPNVRYMDLFFFIYLLQWESVILLNVQQEKKTVFSPHHLLYKSHNRWQKKTVANEIQWTTNWSWWADDDVLTEKCICQREINLFHISWSVSIFSPDSSLAIWNYSIFDLSNIKWYLTNVDKRIENKIAN